MIVVEPDPETGLREWELSLGYSECESCGGAPEDAFVREQGPSSILVGYSVGCFGGASAVVESLSEAADWLDAGPMRHDVEQLVKALREVAG